ncbi:cytochrome c [Yoonia sp. R2331]|uniref:c-type cytochrome n=1 Tax=Yoonia sp. R2331 TaxID=3237238 RepID=UPI0034E3C277
MTLPRSLPTAALLCATLAGAAFAASHLSPEVASAIKARGAHMSLYGHNLGPLGGMAQDKIPYDAAAAAAAAANLAALANMDQSTYWVEGSDIAAAGGRAKSEIWTDSAGFDAEVAKLAEASTALAAVAGNGLDEMKAAFGPVGAACGSCHKAYRGPRP